MRPLTDCFSEQHNSGHIDPEIADIVKDLVIANHILFHQGVLDSFGHVSVRHPRNLDQFLMSRAAAPASIEMNDILVFDREGAPVEETRCALYLERFIHSELYKARGDIHAVVHSHSPTVIPFSITQTKLQPVFHRASFLSPSVPVFEIRDVAEAGNRMLVNDAARGAALARALGRSNVALMRGHGNVVVAPSLRLAVSRAIETEVNAKLLLQAISIGGPINFLSVEEAESIEAEIKPSDARGTDRLWEGLKRLVQRCR